MAPRRWAYIGAQADAQGRPLMTPGLAAPNPNALPSVGGSSGGSPNIATPAFGPIQGVPVYLDGAIPAGAAVSWHYRSAINHGSITGVHKRGTTAANTMYSIAEYDHHPGEPAIVFHSGKALTRTR